jgi:single-stranded DNA-binding protein
VVDPATGNPRTFTRQDGTTGSSLEVRANTVRFLSSRGDQPAEVPAGDAYEGGGNEDDIPF